MRHCDASDGSRCIADSCGAGLFGTRGSVAVIGRLLLDGGERAEAGFLATSQ